MRIGSDVQVILILVSEEFEAFSVGITDFKGLSKYDIEAISGGRIQRLSFMMIRSFAQKLLRVTHT
jgi:hypothetical protein